LFYTIFSKRTKDSPFPPINTTQTYLKFSLTLPLSPAGEREEVRGQQNVRDKFSDFDV
jgi:hypothetical protein